MHLCISLKCVCGCPLRASPIKIQPLLRLHLPVGECGVPHALPCVPTPWPTLFDMANINRCCTVTGSSRLLRGQWNRSCFDCVTENSEEVGVQQETAKNHGCVWRTLGIRGAIRTIVNANVRGKQLTSPSSALWLGPY